SPQTGRDGRRALRRAGSASLRGRERPGRAPTRRGREPPGTPPGRFPADETTGSGREAPPPRRRAPSTRPRRRTRCRGSAGSGGSPRSHPVRNPTEIKLGSREIRAAVLAAGGERARIFPERAEKSLVNLLLLED